MIADYLNFIEIVNKRGNLGIVSRLLNISRHKLMASIANIEKDVGAIIINRQVSPWQLTDKGKQVYREYKDIYNWHNEAKKDVKEQLECKPIKLMIDSNILTLLTHADLIELIKSNTGLLLDVYPFHQYANHESMDIIIADFVPSESQYITEKIFSLKTKLFCSNKYIENYGRISLPTDLIHHQSRLCLYKPMLKNNNLTMINKNDGSIETVKITHCAITFTTNAFRFHDFNNTNFVFAMSDNEHIHEIAYNILPDYELPPIDNYLSVDKYALQSRSEIRELCSFIKSINIDNIIFKKYNKENQI